MDLIGCNGIIKYLYLVGKGIIIFFVSLSFWNYLDLVFIRIGDNLGGILFFLIMGWEKLVLFVLFMVNLLCVEDFFN